MTRTITKRPVWVWQCDECGHEEHYAAEQSGPQGLPTMTDMIAAGWFIADLFGDKCPRCANAKTADQTVGGCDE